MTNQEVIDNLRSIGKHIDERALPCQFFMARNKAIEALEKQIPKKSISHASNCIGFDFYECPTCGEYDISGQYHCDKCGQAISWEVDK